MPELPEVETIARMLRLGGRDQRALVNRHILGANLLWERTLAEPTPTEFSPRLVGQVITDIGRRGKFLYFQLTRDWLLFHLRMSGDLLVRPSGTSLETHDRLILELEGDLQLAFNDARKFGRVWLVEEVDQVVGNLGPEPLDESLTAEDLFARLHALRRQIKPLLRAICSPTRITGFNISSRFMGLRASLSWPSWLRARSSTSRTRLPNCWAPA